MTDPTDPVRRAGKAPRLGEATHNFAQGQAVRLKNAVLSSGSVYRITASLPPTGDSPQYRIRNETENFERMAREQDLELVNNPARDPGAALKNLYDSSRPR